MNSFTPVVPVLVPGASRRVGTTPKQAGMVLQGCRPRTEHSTELFWQCWGNGENGEEEERGKEGSLPSTVLPAFPSSQTCWDSRWNFAIQKL